MRLARVADGTAGAEWSDGGPGLASRIARRARAGLEALAGLGAAPVEPGLEDVLSWAAVLFDAGLHFEVHEWLEPHWRRAAADDGEALRGLIQVAVGYQHGANGNLAGARALLEEGGARLHGRRLAEIDLDPFARAVLASVRTLGPAGLAEVPPFPRRG